MPTETELLPAPPRAGPFVVAALAAAALLFYCAGLRLDVAFLPAALLVLGFASYLLNGRAALALFLFLLPLANSTPDLFLKGYPFNYVGVPLFQLSGMLLAALVKRQRAETSFPGRAPYLLFLALLWISAAFVFLRWSNLGLSNLAFLRDTPVAPSQERLSYACILPAVTLALFSIAPWAAFLIRRQRLDEAAVFAPLKAGFLLSLLLALAQKWIDPELLAQGWWGRKLGQVSGGFSDFNAFGLFAGALFLYQALRLLRRPAAAEAGADRARSGPAWGGLAASGRPWAELLFLAAALAGVFLSGCRTSFLFVLAALGALIASRRPAGWVKVASLLLLAGALLVAGGTLSRRLGRTLDLARGVSSRSGLFAAARKISNARLDMLRDGAGMIGRFPLSGVGAGNFLFHLKYQHHGADAYYDLPLNEYLLVLTETGLLGGAAFLAFMATLLLRSRRGAPRLTLAVMAVALLFNNFFWFPEALILFWCLAAAGAGPSSPPRRWARVAAPAAALLFLAANAAAFWRLHPSTWAVNTGSAFDYGFSYPENDRGRPFRWTAAAAGTLVRLDGATAISLFCGAPLSRLPSGKQEVDVYWRGRLAETVVFSRNESRDLAVGSRQGWGFLEFRVRPAFNLRQMGIGSDPRVLGVQLSGPAGACARESGGDEPGSGAPVQGAGFARRTAAGLCSYGMPPGTIGRQRRPPR
jgi:hypothetical protein